MNDEETNQYRITIVGIGTPHGDDSIGWHVVQELGQSGILPCQLVVARNPIELLDHMEMSEKLHICDACWGEQPGRIHRWQWPQEELTGFRWTGTHDFDVVGALHLGQQLSLLPRETVLWGIEAIRFEAGDSLSESSRQAIRNLAKLIQQEILVIPDDGSDSIL